MRIIIVSAFYSEGMGYTENCLPRAMASLGNEVHVITSSLNVYGTNSDYDATYQSFLGKPDQGVKSFRVDGYTVHRLPYVTIGGYVMIRGLIRKLSTLAPDVVHCTEIASLQCFVLAAAKPFMGFRLFAESHQHLSVVRSFLRRPKGNMLRRLGYWLTRTLPTSIASRSVEKCYAIAPDCAYVANKFYGVPSTKIVMQSLGTDTDLFQPANTSNAVVDREKLRLEFGYKDDDIVCVYTGRFSIDKNPLILAQAVERLTTEDSRWHSLFVGAGVQKSEIEQCENAKTVTFMKHRDLADLYRMADIAVWPRQESMSMLDAAASCLPLIVSADIGESERVEGNGVTYKENDVDDLICALKDLGAPGRRKELGAVGRKKMEQKFSWKLVARSIINDYRASQ